MIKLGVPNENQVKVDNLAAAINNSKLELESIDKSKDVKLKELNDVLTRLDFATEDLEAKTSTANIQIETKQAKIESLNAELSNLESIKADLEEKIAELETELILKKKEITVSVAKHEESENSRIAPMLEEVASLEAKRDELNQYLEVLSLDISSNEVAVNDLKAELSSINDILSGKASENERLNQVNSKLSQENISVLNQISALNADVENLNSIINSLTSEITNIELTKSNLLSEVDQLNQDKEQFAKDKFNFSKEKEMIMLKEAFIIEKYNIAGVPYK